MGRPSSGKERKWVRLPQETWDIVGNLAKRNNNRSRDEQLLVMIEDWLYFTTKGYGPQVGNWRDWQAKNTTQQTPAEPIWTTTQEEETTPERSRKRADNDPGRRRK